MSAICGFIVIFPNYGHFEAIRKSDSGRIVLKPTFSLIISFYLTKTESRTKKSRTQLSDYCFEQKYQFFSKEMLIFGKIEKASVLKGIFSETTICVYLRTKFEVSNIILTSFRQGEGGSPPPPPESESLKSPPRLELKYSLYCFYICKTEENQ